nr:hypothetical protein BCV14_20125 [Vibrio cyclitrophicus]
MTKSRQAIKYQQLTINPMIFPDRQFFQKVEKNSMIEIFQPDLISVLTACFPDLKSLPYKALNVA